jgi:hypothetical protein
MVLMLNVSRAALGSKADNDFSGCNYFIQHSTCRWLLGSDIRFQLNKLLIVLKLSLLSPLIPLLPYQVTPLGYYQSPQGPSDGP